MSSVRIVRSRRVCVAGEERAADLLLRDGRIVRIAEHGALGARDLGDPAPGGAIVDFGAAVVMPGLVDVHCHVNEPGRTAWEGFAHATRAAAAGGITLLADMPLNSSPVSVTPRALELKFAATSGQLLVDVTPYAGVVPANQEDAGLLRDLSRAGAAAFKCFLCDSGLAEFPAAELARLEGTMRILAGLGKRLLVHAEWLGEVDDDAAGAAIGPPPQPYFAYLHSRPESLEVRAIERLCELSHRTGCAVHVVHLSAASALDLLRERRAAGVPVTVETCPHYLCFDAAQIEVGDTRFKCAPPIRSAANRAELWTALADGTIDFVASDHSPCPPDMKALDSGDFAAAWGGIASLQLLLPATWTAARARGHRPAELAAWLCERPARFLGIAERGMLQVGARADLVVWRPEERFRVRGADLHHRHALTPYEDRELYGVVEATFLGGEPVFTAAGGPATEPRGAALRLRAGTASSYPGFAAFERRFRNAPEHLRTALDECCGAQAWRDAMLRLAAGDRDGSPTSGPFWADASCLFAASERCFDMLDEDDWRQAFAAHPRIGDLESLRSRFGATRHLAGAEQSGARDADPEVLRRLAAGNEAYERRFGHVFLICASGRSAEEMLAALERRLGNTPAQELANASEEQRKITFLRLERLLGTAPEPATNRSPGPSR
ncbi:MAG: allantoinase AllB [Acidobacteria bacterium]|nr:MAG: allantoinase AllB [Acidobacteriota bacterium]